jgi:fibronectin-binding autotransporter adhesin
MRLFSASLKMTFLASGLSLAVVAIASPVSSASTAAAQAYIAQVARFNVVNLGPQVEISWVGIKEKDAAYYTIERSSDGVNFLEITRVNAGDTPALLEYFEADRDPLPGVSYYRLKQTLKSGEYLYSDQIVVRRQECGNELMGINAGSEMDPVFFLFSSAFGNEEVLVVVRDKEGKEFFSKVMLTFLDGKIVGFDPDGRIVDGDYIIIASSNDLLQQKKIKMD